MNMIVTQTLKMVHKCVRDEAPSYVVRQVVRNQYPGASKYIDRSMCAVSMNNMLAKLLSCKVVALWSCLEVKLKQ